MFVVLIFIAVAVLVAIAAFYSHKQETERRERLAAFAQQRGWRFEPEPDYSFSDRWQRFSCFSLGHSRRAFNRITGQFKATTEAGEVLDTRIEAGDYLYKYTSGSGKNRKTKTRRLSYLLLETPTPGGDLAVRTEHWGDKLAAGLGFDDIDFESAEFSDRFHVKAADKRFAYDVLHPRMMEFMLGSLSPAFEIRGGVLCVHGGRSRWSPGEYELRLRWIEQFFALWPRHLQST